MTKIKESKLLIDDEPLMVLPKLAVIVGLNEAIVLQQIHYWTEHNKTNNINFYDGYYWTFNTYVDWQIQFPFWSVKTVMRTITNLEKKGLLITAKYNKFGYDKTKWYRIDYKLLNQT